MACLRRAGAKAAAKRRLTETCNLAAVRVAARENLPEDLRIFAGRGLWDCRKPNVLPPTCSL